MDRNYLDKLEREFREQEKSSHNDEHECWSEHLDAALKRGRVYHALAMNTAIRHLFSGMKRTLRLEVAARFVAVRFPSLRRGR